MKALSPKATMAITGAAMATLGIISAGLGPNLEELARNTGSSIASIGSVFSALFLGGIFTQLLGGPLNDRYGQRPVIITGLILMALGCIGMVLSKHLAVLFLCAMITGMGRGAVSISSHLLIARVFAERSAAALNLINVFFGVGAVGGPFVAGLAIQYTGSGLIVFWLSAIASVLMLPLALRFSGKLPGVMRRGEPGAAIAHPIKSPVLWFFCLSQFFYVGGEAGVGGWFPIYLQESAALSPQASAYITSAFWGSITVGRLIAAMIGTKLGASKLFISSILGSCLGATIIVLGAGNLVLSLVGVVVIGISFGPVYPTAMAIASSLFPRSPGTATSLLSAAASLGGVVLPWVQGIIIEYIGAQPAMFMILVMVICMLACDLLRRKLYPNKPTSA
jgi:fucose permease